LALPDVEFTLVDIDDSKWEHKYKVKKALIAFPCAAKGRPMGILPDETELMTEEEQAKGYELIYEEDIGILSVDIDEKEY